MRNNLLLFVQLFIAVSMFGQDFPFQNPELPLEQRLDDLVGRMTLEEKVAHLSFGTPAIERLGIPSYNWWNECLHGVARAGRATIFPQAIGMAATFDEDLLFRVGEVIATEARRSTTSFRKRGTGEGIWDLPFGALM